MLKLNNFALCALALLPIALTAQTPVASAAQIQTANDHHADDCGRAGNEAVSRRDSRS